MLAAKLKPVPDSRGRQNMRAKRPRTSWGKPSKVEGATATGQNAARNGSGMRAALEFRHVRRKVGVLLRTVYSATDS